MFSVLTKSGTTRPRESWQPEWKWTDSQYRELIQLYMNFVDQEEITKGTPPIKPHRNRVLIQRAFDIFARVAPRDCILRALKVCNILEEEPYKLAMDPMVEPSNINICHRAQWDMLKVERMKDQIKQYECELAMIPAREKYAIGILKRKIQERQQCLQRHPTRYYRLGA